MKVTGITPKVAGINEKVAGITPKVTGINQKVAGITPKVTEISEKVVQKNPFKRLNEACNLFCGNEYFVIVGKFVLLAKLLCLSSEISFY